MRVGPVEAGDLSISGDQDSSSTDVAVQMSVRFHAKKKEQSILTLRSPEQDSANMGNHRVRLPRNQSIGCVVQPKVVEQVTAELSDHAWIPIDDSGRPRAKCRTTRYART